MGCLLLLVAILAPRIAAAIIFIFTNWFGQAFDFWLLPLLGFIFMPYTLLSVIYVRIAHDGHFLGPQLILVIVAVCIDLFSNGGLLRKGKKRLE